MKKETVKSVKVPKKNSPAFLERGCRAFIVYRTSSAAIALSTAERWFCKSCEFALSCFNTSFLNIGSRLALAMISFAMGLVSAMETPLEVLDASTTELLRSAEANGAGFSTCLRI